MSLAEVTQGTARAELEGAMRGFLNRAMEKTTLEEISDKGQKFALRTPWGTLIPGDLTNFAREKLPGRGNPIRRIQVAFQPLETGLRGIDNYQTIVSVILPRTRNTTALPAVYSGEQEEYGGELLEFFPSQNPMSWAVSLDRAELIPLPDNLPAFGQDLDPNLIFVVARMIPGIPPTRQSFSGGGSLTIPNYRIL